MGRESVTKQLLITDEAAAEPRITIDVDAIVQITSCAAYAKFGDRLRSLGFSDDTRQGAPSADGHAAK